MNFLVFRKRHKKTCVVLKRNDMDTELLSKTAELMRGPGVSICWTNPRTQPKREKRMGPKVVIFGKCCLVVVETQRAVLQKAQQFEVELDRPGEPASFSFDDQKRPWICGHLKTHFHI